MVDWLVVDWLMEPITYTTSRFVWGAMILLMFVGFVESTRSTLDMIRRWRK